MFSSDQDYLYEYEDDSNLLSTFSVDLFADEEVRDALHLNGDVKRIHKIRSVLRRGDKIDRKLSVIGKGDR